MRKVPLSESLKIIGRGTVNWFTERPLVVSFEVTDSCTCSCKHCDHGGPKDDSRNLKPADYRRYMDVLKPCVVQISGGEPLLRQDVLDIVRNVKSDSGLPYLILVSNWSEMTRQKYLELREAGVHQFSVSLDFPDDRHDEFRQLPGLYQRLSRIVPELGALGYDDIVLNSCITSENVTEIDAMADQAREWGVNICFSSYSPRRIQCRDFFLNTPQQLQTLREQLAKIHARKGDTNWVVNAHSTLDETQHYFETGGMPGCKAGLRFLVVTADGALRPCSMQFKRFGLHEQKRMVEEFTRTNTCDECYVSIRSYLDKTFPQLLREYIGPFFSLKPREG